VTTLPPVRTPPEQPEPFTFPDPSWAVEILPGDAIAHWYAPDGLTRITTTEANHLLASHRRHVASTVVAGWWVSTVFLVLDHGLPLPGRPMARMLWETMSFAHDFQPGRRATDLEDEVSELTDRRHSGLHEARAWHDQAVAALAAKLGVSVDDVVHDPDVAGGPAARGARVWWT